MGTPFMGFGNRLAGCFSFRARWWAANEAGEKTYTHQECCCLWLIFDSGSIPVQDNAGTVANKLSPSSSAHPTAEIKRMASDLTTLLCGDPDDETELGKILTHLANSLDTLMDQLTRERLAR